MSTPQRDSTGTIEAAALPSAALSSIDAIAFHAVDDKELEQLMKVQKPMPLAIAAICGGVFFGTAMQAADAFMSAMSGTPADPDSMIYVAVSALALGIGLSAAVVALRSQSQVNRALEAIRKRSQIQLPSGHPRAPKSRR